MASDPARTAVWRAEREERVGLVIAKQPICGVVSKPEER
jgi:hypothetical protein